MTATGGLDVVELVGEVDVTTSQALRARLDAGLEGTCAGVLIDLTATSFIDSATLGVIASSCQRFRAAGCEYLVVCPPGEVRLMFELTALERVLSLYPTREAALAAIDR
jgi:anti-sigma B factor antagonist